MRKLTLWVSLAVVLAIGLAIVAAFQFGDKSPIFAAGELSIAPELETAAQNIDTLYITVFDAESAMPMPYGAMRQRLSSPAKGSFVHFQITPEKLQVMNPSRPKPKSMRIKARPDLAGVAGMEQSGDLTGAVTGVPFGTTNVAITISQQVE